VDNRGFRVRGPSDHVDVSLERYREAMHRLRPDPRPSSDLPADPDAADLPEGLHDLDGQAVTITGRDRETGELVTLTGVVNVAPELSADVRHDPERLLDD
jgi:hypothetical protein